MPVLYVMGVPLIDSEKLSPSHLAVLKTASLVVGESRNLTLKRIRDSEGKPEHIFFLDNIKAPEENALRDVLKKTKPEVGVLFSDTGLPALFDPGRLVILSAREAGWEIRTLSGPSSWATACALSLMEPPFYIAGFLPQKVEQRKPLFQKWKGLDAHLVFLETPYRYRAFVAQLLEEYGPKKNVFLAWELSGPGEKLFWGNLGGLDRFSQEQNLNKGEFVLILE